MVTRDQQWTVTLADGRQVIVGASINEDRGVWLLPPAPLLRWMTSDDVGLLVDALGKARAALSESPIAPRRRRKRR